MSFSVLVAVACAAFVLSCGASLLGVYWSILGGPKRSLAALISSCTGLLTACFGLKFIHVKAWRTVNGHLEWSVNSHWFFLGALVLGCAAAGWATWTWWKGRNRGTA